MTSDTTTGILEAVHLMTSLGKPDELIASQLGLTTADVVVIRGTGMIPKRQRTLFSDSDEIQKKKPETSWGRVVQACKIQTPERA